MLGTFRGNCILGEKFHQKRCFIFSSTGQVEIGAFAVAGAVIKACLGTLVGFVKTLKYSKACS